MIGVDIGPHPDFPEAYIVMKAPLSMGPDCHDLGVRIGIMHGETGSYTGFMAEWRPTAEELELLNKGEPIRTFIISERLPPMSMWVREQSEI